MSLFFIEKYKINDLLGPMGSRVSRIIFAFAWQNSAVQRPCSTRELKVELLK
jgi:hypothetical protein